MRLAGAFLCAMALTGCGPESNSNFSDTSYIRWSNSSVRASTIADVRQDEVKLCLSGSVTNDEFERAKEWSLRSILTWMRVLKVMDEQVTANVTYTCENYDLLFRLRRGSGTSYANPSATTIYMTRPYGTWTHELGHAFAGLGDTYTNGSAGRCQAGHPESLMCWGAYGPRKDPEEFSTLWQDDIDGIQANYKMLFGEDLTPPLWADDIDLIAPLDPADPWPVANAELSFYDHDVVIDDQAPEEKGLAIDL